MADGKTRILVLGGGLGGVYTAIYLEKGMTRAEREQIEVTFASQENYIDFQPFLPEVTSATIETLHVIALIQRLAKRARLTRAKSKSATSRRNKVRLTPEFVPRPTELEFDHPVLAMGTKMNYSLVAGIKEHAINFKYPGDALRLRNETVRMLEQAENETSPAERKKLLTFVVGGGGFSGVECMA